MNGSEATGEAINAFQKIWGETLVKIMQTVVLPGQSYFQPEMLRQMRGTVFEALTESWDEFMRSPEFLQTMKRGMDQTIKFRKMNNKFMSRVRTELQAPTRDDVEAVAFTVRAIEKRIELLASELAEIKSALAPPKMERPSQRVKTTKNRRKQAARGAAAKSDRPSPTT